MMTPDINDGIGLLGVTLLLAAIYLAYGLPGALAAAGLALIAFSVLWARKTARPPRDKAEDS